jgi:hypothetical protein
MNRFALLFQRESEEGMRLRAQCIHDGDRHAVAGNGEKSDLATVSVNLLRGGLPCRKSASKRLREVDDRDLAHLVSLLIDEVLLRTASPAGLILPPKWYL